MVTDYALIQVDDNIVVNVISADLDEWKPPKGFIVVPRENANIGDVWDTTRFVPPPPVQVVDPNKAVIDRIVAAKTVAELSIADLKMALLKAIG